jgi:hypothetical protein
MPGYGRLFKAANMQSFFFEMLVTYLFLFSKESRISITTADQLWTPGDLSTHLCFLPVAM